MNKTIKKTVKTLAVAAVFCFAGLPVFPQEVPQEETSAVQPVAEETAVAYPILIGIP